MFGGDFFEVLDELFEFLFDDFVVVAAVGVAGDAPMIFFERGLLVVVVGSKADDGFGAGKDCCKIAPLFDFFHVAHLAVMVLLNPIIEGLKVFIINACRRKAY